MERIFKEVIGMKKKLEAFLKKNGFLTLLFLCVCFVAGGTLFLATRDLGTGSDTEIVEDSVYDDLNMDDLEAEQRDMEIFREKNVAENDEPTDEEDEAVVPEEEEE